MTVIHAHPIPKEWEIVKIGNAHGKIALYLDKEEAIAVAMAFPYPDDTWDEIMEAIKKAYPEDD